MIARTNVLNAPERRERALLVNTSVPADVLAWLERCAASERRSLAGFLRELFRRLHREATVDGWCDHCQVRGHSTDEHGRSADAGGAVEAQPLQWLCEACCDRFLGGSTAGDGTERVLGASCVRCGTSGVLMRRVRVDGWF